MSPAARLEALNIVLPPLPSPIANYKPYVFEGSRLYLSGQGPKEASGQQRVGKVGADISVEQAYDDARLTGINLLAVMQAALGDLGRVRQVIKLFGMVNAVDDFGQRSKVINGCSDLFVEVFGDAGRHARFDAGVSSLPGNITVEIEAIIAFHD